MALGHSPSILTNSLLLNVDFANPKSYTQQENMCSDSEGFSTFNFARLTKTLVASGGPVNNNAYVVATVNDSTGGQYLYELSSYLYAGETVTQSWYVSDPDGLDSFVVRFWTGAGRAWTTDRIVTFTLSTRTAVVTSGTVLNTSISAEASGWYRLSITATADQAGIGIMSIAINTISPVGKKVYFSGPQMAKRTGTNTYTPTTGTAVVASVADTISGARFYLYNSQYITKQYVTPTINYLQFTREAVAPKWGGVANMVGTGSLTSANFLYNDHTWEIWFRIDDVTATNLPTNETLSCLALYSGWHSGLSYSSGTMYYTLWNGAASVQAATWTVGTSGAHINQGSWCQLVITRSGNVFTPYINGAPLGLGSTNATTPYSNVSNNLWLGGTANVASGAGDFLYYSKNTIANMKMYNRALSAAEVKQNFNALRGRFGL